MTFGTDVVAGATVIAGQIALPQGVQITTGYETSQVGSGGAVVQGMRFTVEIPGGTTTTVFIPYSQITDTAAVESIVNARVAAIRAITG